MARASDYVVFTGNMDADMAIISALENLRRLVAYKSVKNDIAKYAMPEAFKTELTWTINFRSLQNFLKLRTNKSALWEIQLLARAIYNAIPETHRYLSDDYVEGIDETKI